MSLEYKEILVPGLGSIATEEQARDWLWRAKCDGKPFVCRRCQHEEAYPYASRPEIKLCRRCGTQNRLRVGTAFEKTSTSILRILRMTFLMMQDKRGGSAHSMKRQLDMKSYGTVWSLLQKVRGAISLRNAQYKIAGNVEVDGADFGRQSRRGEYISQRALIAVEKVTWKDDKTGKLRTKAKFARAGVVSTESSRSAFLFSKTALDKKATVHADGNRAFESMSVAQVIAKPMRQNQEELDRWLPLVHRIISNAKRWLMGTHHGIGPKYLARYLDEYFFRFNRRHDPNTLWHRALLACAVTKQPIVASIRAKTG